jgi:hypothetical protein
LFQPGTLGDELAAIVRHPLWSVRAETYRVVNKVRAQAHRGVRRARPATN